MKIKRLFLLLVMFYAVHTQAQIGYQISLLNTATGEPRANETVNVTVTLTNKEGGVIYTGNQTATTNDFGVLSLTIGDADTFKEVDFSKLPFFIEVSANGVMIGRSQVLSVPIAETARKLIPEITKEELCGKEWIVIQSESLCYSFIFNFDGSCQFIQKNNGNQGSRNGTFEIEGKTIYVCLKFQANDGSFMNNNFTLRFRNNELYLAGL